MYALIIDRNDNVLGCVRSEDLPQFKAGTEKQIPLASQSGAGDFYNVSSARVTENAKRVASYDDAINAGCCTEYAIRDNGIQQMFCPIYAA